MAIGHFGLPRLRWRELDHCTQLHMLVIPYGVERGLCGHLPQHAIGNCAMLVFVFRQERQVRGQEGQQQAGTDAGNRAAARAHMCVFGVPCGW